jgi:serine O-acetyltransferase
MGILDDVRTAYRKDPALHGAHAVEVLFYSGLWAIWFHRVAHRLWLAKIPVVPRLVSEVAKLVTGIEIHPGARLGRRLFIDHGTGIVIGETAEVGDDCVLYHGVTLGARGWWVDTKGAKRHPTIGSGVTLAVGSSVLGAITVGDGSRIGPNAVVIEDVPAGCVVVAPPSRCVRMRGEEHEDPDDANAAADVPAWLTTHELGGL